MVGGGFFFSLFFFFFFFGGGGGGHDTRDGSLLQDFPAQGNPQKIN